MPSAPDSPAEIATMNRNQERVAARGREPGLLLQRGGRDLPMKDWGAELLSQYAPIAERLDAAFGGAAYRDAVAGAAATLDDPQSVPSARVLHAMQRNHGGSYLRFALAESLLHRGALAGRPLPAAVAEAYRELARSSLAEQRDIEASDRIDFETWRRQYLDPANLKI